MKEEQERKKTLVKYIPTISKALFNVLQKMEVKLKRKSNSSINDGSNSSSSSRRDSKKRGRDDEPSMNDGLNNESHSTSIWSNMMTDVTKKVITENSLSEYLQNGVDKFEIDAMLQSSIYQEGHRSINSGGGGGDVKRQKVFIIPSTQLMSYGTMLDRIIRGYRSSSSSSSSSSASSSSSSSSSSSATGRPHDSSLSDVVHNSTSKTKLPSTHDDVIDLTDDTTVKTIHTTRKDVQKPAFKWVPFPITSTTHTIVGTNTAHFVGYVLVSNEETL